MKWSSISFRKRLLIIMTVTGLVELLILSAAGFAYIKHSQEEEMGLKALGGSRVPFRITTCYRTDPTPLK